MTPKLIAHVAHILQLLQPKVVSNYPAQHTLKFISYSVSRDDDIGGVASHYSRHNAFQCGSVIGVVHYKGREILANDSLNGDGPAVVFEFYHCP